MKKLILIFSLISIAGNFILAQSLPHSFRIGEQRLFKMSDPTPASNSIEDIIVTGNTIWLATSEGPSKSDDNGATWTNFSDLPEFFDELAGVVGYSEGAIWTATWHYEELIGENQPVGSGLKYSTDEGATWVSIDQPVDQPNDSLITYGGNTIKALPITVAVANLVYDIAFTPNTIWIATFAGGLRKSTDMGQTWQRVVLPPDYLDEINLGGTYSFDLSPQTGALGFEENFNHRVFSVEAVDDTTLYVGTAAGINKSTDGGISWRKFNHTNQTSPISGNFILALRHDPVNDVVWAGTWQANDNAEDWAVSFSSDGGESWQTTLHGTRPLDFTFKYVEAGPAVIETHVVVATQDGLYRTKNGGTTWIAAPDIQDDITKVRLSSDHFLSVRTKMVNDHTSDIWIGSKKGLAKLTQTNEFWEGEWKVYKASEQITDISQTYAFPNPFNPSRGNTTIKYAIANSADVTIRIFDFGMNIVRTLIQNAPRGTSNDLQELWDAKDDNGNNVINGVYFYRIDTDSDEPLFGKIMVIR